MNQLQVNEKSQLDIASTWAVPPERNGSLGGRFPEGVALLAAKM
ncbi:hypothetical protein [Microcoleus sp. D2_18a_D3]